MSTLTDEQLRGASCVRCCLPMWTGNSVDLNQKTDSTGIRVFLRAHRACPEALS